MRRLGRQDWKTGKSLGKGLMAIKFTDGNWLVKKGVKIFSPAALYDYETGDGTLTLYAPARPIHHKGDTLQGPLFTIELSSLAPGGDQGPFLSL